jgi:hypothetical protein
MKDTCSKRFYKCKCGTLNECYVWESQLKTHDFGCVKCNALLGLKQLQKKKEVNKSAAIRTPTKNR